MGQFSRYRQPASLFITTFLLVISLGSSASFAATNIAVDGGSPFNLLDSGLVTVNALGGGAVTSARAEINPAVVTAGSLANNFTVDLTSTINPSATGLDQFTLTAPVGYNLLGVSGLTIDGTPMTFDCALDTADDYCPTVGALFVTVNFRDKITANPANIRFNLTADVPPVPGSASFSATVDDTTTIVFPPQAVNPANADGDGSNNNSLTVSVVLVAPDLALSTVTANPIMVIADGSATSVITTTMFDTSGNPLGGRNITLSSSRGATDTFITISSPSDPITGEATGTVSSSTPGTAVITATDITDPLTPLVLPMTTTVYFTRGQVLEVTKTSNRKEAGIGELVSYDVTIRNLDSNLINSVKLNDLIPPNFKYLKNSGMMNGTTPLEPTGNRPLVFDIGTIPIYSDTNSNGTADLGDAGFISLSYQLIIGSGATPGDYTNTAFATDVCDQCLISNRSQAEVQVTLDPLFDLGTVIGKVFRDKNHDGWQDHEEEGIAGAMVALDSGIYALTDENGRYHFPAVTPGHRLVKLNIQTLPGGAEATTGETRVVTITQGLLAKANFGITYDYEEETIGSNEIPGIKLSMRSRSEPLQIVGSTTAHSLIINDKIIDLPSSEVQLSAGRLADIVEMKGSSLEEEIQFIIAANTTTSPLSWHFDISTSDGELIRQFRGKDLPPEVILWDGVKDSGKMISGGEIYQYQMEIVLPNDHIVKSPKQMFGVNVISILSLNLSGGAFVTGSERLNNESKWILKKSAEILRQHPKEKIVIEGHTDSVGNSEYNMELSKKRAEAAAEFLTKSENIPADRFVIKWFGETRPLAPNKIADGRELNRRVEVSGEIKEVDAARLQDQYRTEPRVTINEQELQIDNNGRFDSSIAPDQKQEISLEMSGAGGESVITTIALPSIKLSIKDRQDILLPFGKEGNGYQVFVDQDEQAWDEKNIALSYTLSGQTEPGNRLEIDGKGFDIDSDGTFQRKIDLRLGTNHFGLVAHTLEGVSTITNLSIVVRDRDKKGAGIIAVPPVPYLSVKLPPGDGNLNNTTLSLSGKTSPGNLLTVNSRTIELNADGSFVTNLTLPIGKSEIKVTATDPEGYQGTITRPVNVSGNKIFYLAIADAKIGQVKSKGYLDGTGLDNSKDYFTEGRLAFYLKGHIKGKYLLTAAFDSGTNEFEKLFDDLDNKENDRFLTNIDPDKLYPVYGDSSTLVYDTDSQGKLYLALDSDEFSLLVGNYKVSLNDTELATFNRTLFGARARYTSASRTKNGQPDTTLIIFGAQVRQEHVRDRLRATGGSLYYLSRREIIEGSEQVQLVIRDKNTGLQISRISQRQNYDYDIKYDEGRMTFKYPVSSIAESSMLIDQAILAGNPVYIEVDYETNLDTFEKTGGGIRAKQQLSDNISVGATYIKDELQTDSYEMQAVDSEIRFAGNSRVLLEYADSTGLDSATYESNDGGLTYIATTPTGTLTGSAWKASAELDIGEWLEKPGQTMLGAYYKKIEGGFLSSGNSSERGSEKSGVKLSVKLTDADQFKAHYDIEKYELGIPANAEKIGRRLIQFTHNEEKWDLSVEYLMQDHTNPAPTVPDAIDLAALRLRYKLTDKLLLSGEHQHTVSGPDNDQSTLGVDYKLLEFLDLTARATSGDLGNSGQFGAQLAIGEKRFYLTERITDGQAGHSTATILGTETPVGKTGKVYSEYQWQHTDNIHQATSIIGASNKLAVAKNLEIKMSGEMADLTSTVGNTSRYTLALGATYQRPALKAMTSNEIRFEEGATERTQYLTSNLLQLKLNQDLTMLGKYRYSVTENTLTSTIEAQFTEFSIGFAYRPVAFDRLNGLARFTHLLDQNPLTANSPVLSKITKNVGSLEWSYDINRKLEWVGKSALKISSDETGLNPSFTSHTYLLIQRLNYRFMDKFDLGTEFRTLTQDEADDQRSGFLTELMWEVVDNARLGLGYNFTDFSDNEFSDNDYSVEGWFVRMQAIY